MKKFIISIFVGLIICSFWGCTLNLEKSSENLNSYNAKLVYDNNSHQLSGVVEINFINKNKSSLSSIELNIYANAFRENSTQSVISLSKSEACYYNGVSYGNIEIIKVFNDENLKYEIGGDDQNVLIINLPQKLEPFKSINFSIEFIEQLPNINHRFGYGENTINLGNFLPTLCVYENGKWCEITYHSNGDPFYSEVANYEVEVTYPNNLIIASSGIQTQTTKQEKTLTTKIEAQAVRDFAIVFSEQFEKIADEVDDITVNYYYFDDLNAQSNLQTAIKAVKTFNDLFGKYPYKELNVVQANFCIGGMEFPNIVLIGDFIKNKNSYEMVIIHEIAHQWWYGIVGNNQTQYAFLDEGLAEFSTALFYEKNKNYDYSYELIMQNANQSMQTFQKVYTTVVGNANTTMNRSLQEFSNENEYTHTAYVQSMLMFDSLSKLLSEKVVIKCLKNYFSTYAFSIVSPELLIASFEKTTSCNLEEFFNSWINGKVVFIR